MYAIKARFDGQKITPEEPVPVNRPYEAIVTFTEPAKEAKKPEKSFLDGLEDGPILDDETFNIIMDGIRERREPYGRYSNDIF